MHGVGGTEASMFGHRVNAAGLAPRSQLVHVFAAPADMDLQAFLRNLAGNKLMIRYDATVGSKCPILLPVMFLTIKQNTPHKLKMLKTSH